MVVPSNEPTSIQSSHYGKEGHGCVNVVLKNANSQAIQAVANLVELQKVKIDSPDIKLAQIQEILKIKSLKTLDLGRMILSEKELEQLRQQYPEVSIKD
jgi:hypothetical protein